MKARDELGVKSVEVTLPDGSVVATVTVAGGGESATVRSDVEFVGWVKSHYPSEIVEAVRPAFQKHILGRVEQAGERFVEPTTGQIVDGLGLRGRSEYISVRFKPEGRAEIAAAWRGGEIGALLAGQPALDIPKD